MDGKVESMRPLEKCANQEGSRKNGAKSTNQSRVNGPGMRLLLALHSDIDYPCTCVSYSECCSVNVLFEALQNYFLSRCVQ